MWLTKKEKEKPKNHTNKHVIKQKGKRKENRLKETQKKTIAKINFLPNQKKKNQIVRLSKESKTSKIIQLRKS